METEPGSLNIYRQPTFSAVFWVSHPGFAGGACLDTSGGERPARAEERAGWMENATAVAAFEANQV